MLQQSNVGDTCKNTLEINRVRWEINWLNRNTEIMHISACSWFLILHAMFLQMTLVLTWMLEEPTRTWTSPKRQKRPTCLPNPSCHRYLIMSHTVCTNVWNMLHGAKRKSRQKDVFIQHSPTHLLDPCLYNLQHFWCNYIILLCVFLSKASPVSVQMKHAFFVLVFKLKQINWKHARANCNWMPRADSAYLFFNPRASSLLVHPTD